MRRRGRRGRAVEGAVGALVGAAHLADTQDVQRGGIECLHIELLWSQRLYDHRLSGPSQVGHWEISGSDTVINKALAYSYLLRYLLTVWVKHCI